jgi:hypothetical protein
MFQRILIIKKAHMFLSFKTVPEEKYLRQTGADYLPPPTPPPSEIANGLFYFLLLANNREYLPWGE